MFAEHHLVLLPPVNWATASSSVWTDALRCPFDISCSESCSGLCQCSFSTAPVWMMRFSSLRGVWREKCTVQQPDYVLRRWALPSMLCLCSGTNCWPQIKCCTVKKEELWHLCCHAVHLRPRCAPGPALLWNWTNWCLEMHPAAVLKHSEPFVSILQDIYRTFISSANVFLSSTVLLTGRALCYLSSCKYLHKNMFKARYNSHYWCLCRASENIHTTKLWLFTYLASRDPPLKNKGIFCCVRIWREIWLW